MRKIAIGLGIGGAVYAGAAGMECPNLCSPCWRTVAPQCRLQLRIEPRQFVSRDGFQLKIDLSEFVRSLKFEEIQLPTIIIEPALSITRLDCLEGRFDSLSTVALAAEPSVCPDRPVIPDWAWAWELSSPEAW